MAKVESCPKCSGTVEVYPSSGGRNSGNLTMYYAECFKCGEKVDNLGATKSGMLTGKKATAIADWNRYAKAERIRAPSTIVPAKR